MTSRVIKAADALDSAQIGTCIADLHVASNDGTLSSPDRLLRALQTEILPALSEVLEQPPIAFADAEIEILEIDLGNWPDDPDWVDLRAVFAQKLRTALAPYLRWPTGDMMIDQDVTTDIDLPLNVPTSLKASNLRTRPSRQMLSELTAYLAAHPSQRTPLLHLIFDTSDGAETILGKRTSGTLNKVRDLLSGEPATPDPSPQTAPVDLGPDLANSVDLLRPDWPGSTPQDADKSDDTTNPQVRSFQALQSSIATIMARTSASTAQAQAKAAQLAAQLVLHKDMLAVHLTRSAPQPGHAPPPPAQQKQSAPPFPTTAELEILLQEPQLLMAQLQGPWHQNPQEFLRALAPIKAPTLAKALHRMTPANATLLKERIDQLQHSATMPALAMVHILQDLILNRQLDFERAATASTLPAPATMSSTMPSLMPIPTQTKPSDDDQPGTISNTALPSPETLRQMWHQARTATKVALRALSPVALTDLAARLVPATATELHNGLATLSQSSRHPQQALASALFDALDMRPINLEAAAAAGAVPSSKATDDADAQTGAGSAFFTSARNHPAGHGPQASTPLRDSSNDNDAAKMHGGATGNLPPSIDNSQHPNSPRGDRTGPDAIQFQDTDVEGPLAGQAPQPTLDGSVHPLHHRAFDPFQDTDPRRPQTGDASATTANTGLPELLQTLGLEPHHIDLLMARYDAAQNSAAESQATQPTGSPQDNSGGLAYASLAPAVPILEGFIRAAFDVAGHTWRPSLDLLWDALPAHDRLMAPHIETDINADINMGTSTQDALTPAHDPRYWQILFHHALGQNGTALPLNRALDHALIHLQPDPEKRLETLRVVTSRLTYATGTPAGTGPGMGTPANRHRTLAALELILQKMATPSADQKITSYQPTPSNPEPHPQDHVLTTQSAGIVLIHPFLRLLFDRLDVLGEDAKIPPGKAPHALAILQAVVDLPAIPHAPPDPLHLVLLGLPTGPSTLTPEPLDQPATDMIDGLLHSMIERWGKLGKTSPDGLREAFLRRDGTLSFDDTGTHLQVSTGPYDMLLDGLPWSVGPIAMPWMKWPCHVAWRDDDV